MFQGFLARIIGLLLFPKTSIKIRCWANLTMISITISLTMTLLVSILKRSKIGDRNGSVKDIATWVANLEPKLGVAFGNAKTHKEGNPLRLITSCCRTAIERLSAFTEFYLKPLAQTLPSFVKDTTDLINKIQTFNSEKGPLPTWVFACLLGCSFDVPQY